MFRSNTLLLIIKPHSLTLFAHDFATPTVIDVPTEVVDNLEVIDIDKFYALIADWCKTRTYQNTDLVILLDPTVCFEQTLPESEQVSWDTKTLQFLDSVPFEEVLSHLYHPVAGREIVATNKALITAISHGFALHGYNTRLIVPLKQTGLTDFSDRAKVKHLLSHLNSFAKDSMTVEPAPSPTLTPTNPTPSTNNAKSKSQLPLLLGVFGVLLAVLVGMLLWM